MKNEKIVTNYKAVPSRDVQGLVFPERMSAPPWKNVLDIV